MKKKITAALASAGLLLTMGFAAVAPAQAVGPVTAPATALVSAPSTNIGAFATVKKYTQYGKAAKVLADGYAVRVWTTTPGGTTHSFTLKKGEKTIRAHAFSVPSGKKAKVTNYLGKTATLGPGKYNTIKGASHSIKIYNG